MQNKQTAAEYLMESYAANPFLSPEHFKKAEEMERQQHGQTWDAAIEACHARGYNLVRAICDFDEFYKNNYGK